MEELLMIHRMQSYPRLAQLICLPVPVLMEGCKGMSVHCPNPSTGVLHKCLTAFLRHPRPAWELCWGLGQTKWRLGLQPYSFYKAIL